MRQESLMKCNESGSPGPWKSEVEDATSRSRWLPTILRFTSGWGKKHFCYFQTAKTEKRTPNSSVKGSGANHYLRAPAQRGFAIILISLSRRETVNQITENITENRPRDTTIYQNRVVFYFYNYYGCVYVICGDDAVNGFDLRPFPTSRKVIHRLNDSNMIFDRVIYLDHLA